MSVDPARRVDPSDVVDIAVDIRCGVPRGGQPPSSTESQRCHLGAGDDGDNRRGDTDTLYAAADDGLSTIHSTYYHYYLVHHLTMGKAAL